MVGAATFRPGNAKPGGLFIYFHLEEHQREVFPHHPMNNTGLSLAINMLLPEIFRQEEKI